MMRKNSIKKEWLVVLCLALSGGGTVRADLNVLVIGSSESFAATGESGAVQEQAFSPVAIANELRSILDNDPAVTGSVHVVMDDIYRSKTMDTAIGGSAAIWSLNYRAHSLAQYYFWPEGRTNRLENLGSEQGTNWDYVVMMDDPYLLANMPGIHAEGVKLVAKAAAAGGAQPILLGQWPASNSGFSNAHFNEISYRVGEGLDIPVVPAALAWDTLLPKDVALSHPTTNGAYLAASAIYGEMFGRSASASGYTYDDGLADHAYNTVSNAESEIHFSGKFGFETPFSMKTISSRHIDFNHTGSSSENGILTALRTVMTRCGISHEKYGKFSNWPAGIAPVDFNYGRANTNFEPAKQYVVDTNLNDRAYGFPMQDHSNTATETMLYGIDKRHWYHGTYEDGTDLGIAYDMIRQGEVSQDIRTVPIRLMWAKMHDIRPALSVLRDSWHMSHYLDEATATFMYTLLSGRCPVGDEPATPDTGAWYRWMGRTVGYQTAWRMAHLQDRAPGFEVLPRTVDAHTVDLNAESLTVRFLYAPRSNVTVNVSFSDPVHASVSPAQLIFTPENYNVEQTVTLSTIPGTAVETDSSVQFETVSDDPSFDGLIDSWLYSFELPGFSAFPFAEDFESFSTGQELAGTNGWTGSGIISQTNYAAAYSGAQPLPESNHSQVLDSSNSSLSIEPGAALPGVWFDSVIQFGKTGALETVSVPEKAQAWFGVDANQNFNVYHAVNENSAYSNTWTALTQNTISIQQWLRLTVEISYTNAVQSRTFFRVYLNSGNALSSPMAYQERNDSAPSAEGTWFLCANQTQIAHRVSGLKLEGAIRCDDLVLTTNAVIIGDALDRDFDGMPDWQEDIAGTDSTNHLSLLEITGINTEGNQRELNWQAVTGKTYSVWFKTNLLDTSWMQLTNGIPGTEPVSSAIIQSDSAEGFIRIEVGQ